MASAAAATTINVSTLSNNKLSLVCSSSSIHYSRKSTTSHLSSSSFPLSISTSSSFFNTKRLPLNRFFPSSSSHDETNDAVVTDDPPQAEDTTTTTEDDEIDGADKSSPASILAALESYKEALADNDASKLSQIESHFKSLEEDKLVLKTQLATLSEELSSAKDRVLRISADFDNFRKRTERERISLVANAQGEVVENLLPVLDNFQRAKAAIKVENEKEETINNSYQSIYKQFVEILNSLGVVPVETTGQPFDPLANPRVGSKFSRVLDDLFQKLSGVIKT
uniref:protein GrpE-like isoform X2 n=1 Tax=Erigeron canadensis TaxID=72917 RepID=UPI001CB9C379|nr:protein GrpE-like isoform X2 [Erigeron canadensis]